MAQPTKQFPDRLVLENVPRVNFYEGGPRCPEDLCLASVLRALGEYFQEDAFGCRTCRAVQPGCQVNCSYSFFIGITGIAAFLSWKKGWIEDNTAAFYMSDDPAAPERWGMRALGYGFEWVERAGGEGSLLESDRRNYRQRILESIQRGKPVIGYGVVGPPEPAIITGYDDGGDVLSGWSFFQNIPGCNDGVEFEPNGYFRKRDWFKDTHSLLVIGEKQERPKLAELYRDALQWMLKVHGCPRSCRERMRPDGTASAPTAWQLTMPGPISSWRMMTLSTRMRRSCASAMMCITMRLARWPKPVGMARSSWSRLLILISCITAWQKIYCMLQPATPPNTT